MRLLVEDHCVYTSSSTYANVTGSNCDMAHNLMEDPVAGTRDSAKNIQAHPFVFTCR